jgi:hypothetical protein
MTWLLSFAIWKPWISITHSTFSRTWLRKSLLQAVVLGASARHFILRSRIASHEMEEAASAITVFESTLLKGRKWCNKLSIQAGAVAYALSTISATTKSLRCAGQSCMQQLFNADNKLDDKFLKVEGTSDLRETLFACSSRA